MILSITNNKINHKFLGDWFRELFRDFEKNDKDASKPVAHHFNLPNHSKLHMAICHLSQHQGMTESRKNLEQKSYHLSNRHTKSLPYYSNKRFSFK